MNTDFRNDQDPQDVSSYVIEQWQPVVGRPKRGTWQPVRSPHGSREVLVFHTFKRAKNYVRRHVLWVAQTRIKCQFTGQTWPVSGK
jgi:hypothetical protein